IVSEKIKSPMYSILKTNLGICPFLFVNDFTNDVFERYFWEKKYSEPSFNSLDETPEYWLKTAEIIDSEIIKINKQKENSDLIESRRSNPHTNRTGRQSDNKTFRD
ncbi:MAG: hypothetical protein KJ941_09635, partial [Bacteroidetes bacterium]|nr:hypothetical protein [Bacteroidota bacterium]